MKHMIYLSGSLDPDTRPLLEETAKALRQGGLDVYAPWEHKIEHAWDLPNNEWGLLVFQADIKAIQESDWIVVFSWGRKETTAGTAWEQGFAYGIGKPVLLVELNDKVQSLMVANGRYATIKWESGNIAHQILEYLTGVFFVPGERAPQLRTKTEQK